MLLKTRSKDDNQGFTLVELLVVIIIIGILAAVAIPAFLNQRQRANDAAVKSDVKNIALSAETLVADNPVGPISKSSDGKAIISGSLTEPVAITKGVHWDIYGSTLGYCIIGWHDNGKSFSSFSSPLSYDSTSGGLKSNGQECGSISNAPNGTPISGVGDSSEPTVYAWTGSPNASASTAVGSTITRTNLVNNPSAESNGAGFSFISGNGGGVSSWGRISTGGIKGSGFMRSTMTTGSSLLGNLYWGAATGSGSFVSVVPGNKYTVSSWVRSNKSVHVRTILVTHTDSTGSGWGTPGFTDVIIPANTWTRVNATGVPSAGHNYAQIVVEILEPTTSVGDTFDVDGEMIEKSDTLGPYFDGYTTSTS